MKENEIERERNADFFDCKLFKEEEIHSFEYGKFLKEKSGSLIILRTSFFLSFLSLSFFSYFSSLFLPLVV